MKHKIFGIENIKELDAFPENFSVRIHLKSPDYIDILHLVPKERIKVIRQRRRDDFKAFIKDFDRKEYQRIGSRISPSGLETSCSKKEVLKLNKNTKVKYISILTSQQSDDLDVEPIELLFAVKARFAIQIENRSKGLQSYEDRLLLIQAISGEEAEKKLKKGFKGYEKPYMNTYGELVRWKFEEFIDRFDTGYSSLEEMLVDEKEGIELFSSLKSRRLNNDRIWKRENS